MYIVIELQTTDGATANIVQTKETKDQAMSTYHSILASAAVSSVEFHTAVVMDVTGRLIARECYEHHQVLEESE